jgi:DNA-binding SARP family transcriptional activator
MEFRILGPLEVRDGERIVSIRRGKHQALLAALLLRTGEPVSVDQLLDDLWGERPPSTAKGSLQNMVSALRKTLGEPLLRTQSPGYVLDIEREQVDLFRFERLLEEAKCAASTEKRAEQLRQAHALWRGPPLADLAFEPFVLLEVPRLEELRVVAHEELVEARLALGEHAQLIPELEPLVAGHPFNERLRGQLMLALYRAGRQADALDCYRQARQLLVEELGLEPGTPLRELEQAILRHDSALAAAPARQPNLLPTRKTATVLYADLVASGALSGQLDPEALDQLLAPFSATAQQTLARNGGTVEILPSGVVFAVFGVPRAHEDDALRALRAAGELRSELEALGGHLEARIGITTGEVFAGGKTGRVTGAVIEVVKRLSGTASAGEIVVGAPTVRLVREAVKLEPRAPLLLAEEQPLGAWRLVELIEGAPAIPRRFEAVLVGRRHELTKLRRAFGAARTNSRCQLVILVGDPGIGKTRLAREFLAEVAQDAAVLVGSCTSYGQGATWLPLLEILREGRLDTTEALSSLLSTQQDGELAARRIAAAVGLAEEPAPLAETNWAFRRLFETLAAQRPLVVVFEDVHWAEATLLDLIEELAERAAGPMLVFCLARPELLEARAAWAQRALMLAGLPEAEVGTLVDALQAELDADVRARVVELAEGNPLFGEQLVARVQEEGAESLDVAPASIEALLASRLDLVSAEERAFLHAAAVLGRRFSRAAVLELSAADPAAADLHLEALMDKGLVRGEATEDSLSFHHMLVRNVAYAGIPKGVRADLHERAADWLVRHDDLDEIVGYHLEQAYRNRLELAPLDEHTIGLGRRGARRLAAAAERAVAAEDMPAAAALFDRAAGLLPQDDLLRLRLLTRLGHVLGWLGALDFQRALSVTTEAIERARALGASEIEWGARLERSFVSRGTGRQPTLARAQEAERAVKVFEKLGHEAGLMKAWHLLGLVRWDLGHARAAMEAVERALAHATRLKDAFEEREIRATLGHMAVYGPTPVEDAFPLLVEQLNLARARNHPLWEAHCQERLAMLDAMQGLFDEARARLTEARVRREELGDTGPLYFEAAGFVEQLYGDPVAAEGALRDAYRLYERHARWAYASTVAANLAQVVRDQGLDAEALQLAERSKELAAQDPESQAGWRRARARVLAHRSCFDEAEQLAQEAVRFLAATDDVRAHADALVDLAEVRRLAGRHDEAIRAVERALPLYEQKGNIVRAERTRTLLDEVKASRSPAG